MNMMDNKYLLLSLTVYPCIRFLHDADDIASGTYDQRDLDRFVADDNFAGCFLINHRSRGDVGKAAENADVVFKFRKEKAIWGWYQVVW